MAVRYSLFMPKYYEIAWSLFCPLSTSSNDYWNYVFVWSSSNFNYILICINSLGKAFGRQSDS